MIQCALPLSFSAPCRWTRPGRATRLVAASATVAGMDTPPVHNSDVARSTRNRNRFEVSIDVIRYRRYAVEDRDVLSEIVEEMKVTRGQNYAPIDVYKIGTLYYAAGGRNARLEAIRRLGWLMVRVRVLGNVPKELRTEDFHPFRLKGDKRGKKRGRKPR